MAGIGEGGGGLGGGGEGEAVDWTCVTFVSKTKDVDA